MEAWGDQLGLFGTGALGGGVGLGLVAWGSVFFYGRVGFVNSRWARALLYGHIQRVIGEHWGGVRSENFVCVWRPGFVDWAA